LLREPFHGNEKSNGCATLSLGDNMLKMFVYFGLILKNRAENSL